MAAWGYDLMTFPDKQGASDLLHNFFNVTMGPYWDRRLEHVKHHYKGRCAVVLQFSLMKTSIQPLHRVM